MLERILELREMGYSFRKIAKELGTTVGKVQYRYQKYQLETQITNEEESMKLINQANNLITKSEFSLKNEREQISLLPQGPTSVYAYWEITSQTREMAEHQCRSAWSEIEKVIRLYDITALEFNGQHAHRWFDVRLPEMTNNWYFHGLEANRTYIVDLGVRTNEGTFLSISRSNAIDTPRMSEKDRGIHHEAVNQWREGNQEEPNWLEHFSTYSYYESIK